MNEITNNPEIHDNINDLIEFLKSNRIQTENMKQIIKERYNRQGLEASYIRFKVTTSNKTRIYTDNNNVQWIEGIE